MHSGHEFIQIAKRENNNKRNYLLVNSLQGKHIPVQPSKAFLMFNELAGKLKTAYQDEKLLIIGFAETATAIGTAVSEALDSFYIHTTRENISQAQYLYFSEEHSHAAEQKLVKGELDKLENKISRVIFAEDEITTGKTILNIISVLKKHYPWIKHYGAASILNGMGNSDIQLYKSHEIDLHYLVKADNTGCDTAAEKFKNNGRYFICDNNSSFNFNDFSFNEYNFNTSVPYMDTRRLVSIKDYVAANFSLWEAVKNTINFSHFNKVLVLGTEEFMYPALFIARKLEEIGIQAKSHSTTRSPISVSENKAYPLHTRYELKSLYDFKRTTYIYELDSYDCVLIMTDSPPPSAQGTASLLQALKLEGNNQIYLIRWL